MAAVGQVQIDDISAAFGRHKAERRGRSNGKTETVIRPERFARLVTLAGMLIGSALNDSKLLTAEGCDELGITVTELTSDAFKPEQYADEYRGRVLAAVEQKVEGREVTSLAPQAQRAQVIDLMDALKQSLGKRGGEATGGRGAKVAGLEKKPAARARQKAEPVREKKVGGKR